MAALRSDGTIDGWRFSATMNWDDSSNPGRLGSGGRARNRQPEGNE